MFRPGRAKLVEESREGGLLTVAELNLEQFKYKAVSTSKYMNWIRLSCNSYQYLTIIFYQLQKFSQ